MKSYCTTTASRLALVVSIDGDDSISKMLKFLHESLLCDGQGIAGELSCTKTGLV